VDRSVTFGGAVWRVSRQAGVSVGARALGNPMGTNRGEYRLVVGSDPREFAREVSKALADGWELYGEPILREAPGGRGGADTADDSPRYLLGQAVTRPSLALR
jgi:hypothetical protein